MKIKYKMTTLCKTCGGSKKTTTIIPGSGTTLDEPCRSCGGHGFEDRRIVYLEEVSDVGEGLREGI